MHTVRMTLTEIGEQCRLDPSTWALQLPDGREIAVVYFRSGYSPIHYPTDLEWSARLMMERSKAIKCPWIGYHLAGCKKIQQVLSNPTELERYGQSKSVQERILASSALQLGFNEVNNESNPGIEELLMKNPDEFVLKPQREGGGNNLYGQEIVRSFKELSAEERGQYVLMERLRPPVFDNYLITAYGAIELRESVSELGMFGFLIGNKEKILQNEADGFLFRTKLAQVNEGGLMSGVAALDTPWLID